jgi:hypothetical protein
MSEDEFRADLRWPTDPLGERPPAHLADDEPDWEEPVDRDDAVSSVDRSVAEEVDRLATRILERLRSTRTAIEGDLAEVRSELAAIRQGLSALAERATGPAPAAAPAPPPDLEPLRADVADLRASVDGLATSIAGAITPDRFDDIADELSGVQAELVSLRRRITLRAPGAESSGLTDEQLDRLAEAVAAKLRADGRRGSR